MVGSVNFLPSRIICRDPDYPVNNLEKTLISTVLRLLNNFMSLNICDNVPTVSVSKKTCLLAS